jgi:hypothetical protein
VATRATLSVTKLRRGRQERATRFFDANLVAGQGRNSRFEPTPVRKAGKLYRDFNGINVRGFILTGAPSLTDDSITLPRGRELVTLRGAGEYISALPRRHKSGRNGRRRHGC